MSTQKQVLSLAVLAILAVSCASDFQVSSTWDPLSAFPKQATYAWDDAISKLPTDERLAPLDIGSALKKAAEKSFAAHGYTVTTASPDYTVSYQLGIHNFIGADESSSQATLSLQMAKADNGHRVWNGFARADIHIGATQEAKDERLQKMMDDLLKKFPPNQE